MKNKPLTIAILFFIVVFSISGIAYFAGHSGDDAQKKQKTVAEQKQTKETSDINSSENDDYDEDKYDDEDDEYEEYYNEDEDDYEYEYSDYDDLLEDVNSTCFSRVGYDCDEEILYVEFLTSGYIYAYSDFPEDEYDDFMDSYSLGRYYNYYIKGQYPCTRLE